MRLLSSLNGLAAAGLGVFLSGTSALAQALETVGRPIAGGTEHQPPGTTLARDMQWLDHVILIIITAVVVLVTALLLIVIFRFNAKRNPKPATFSHNTPLEIAWTMIPVLLLVFIGSFSLPELFRQQEIPQADITIKVTGNQWYWSYEYVDDGVSFDSFLVDASYKIDDAAAGWGADQEMGPAQVMSDLTVKKLAYFGYTKEDFLLATDTAVVVPIGKTIVMQITGSDVIHAWSVPAFGVMQSAVPGRLGQLWFNADREGIYFGQCTTLCGKSHAYMPITVKVVSQEAYDKWLAGAKDGKLQLASN